MSKLLVKIRADILNAVRSGDSETRDILKTVAGELQSAEMRGTKVTDDFVIKTLRKFREGSVETLNASGGIHQHSAQEILTYDQYIPAIVCFNTCLRLLEVLESDLNAAKSDGQAVGIAMKHLKSLDLDGILDGKIVKAAVEQHRKS